MQRPEETKKDWEFELQEEGEENTLFIYLENTPYIPSVEDNEICMSKSIEILTQLDRVTKIIFTQKRDYEYDFEQTQMLVELARLYKKFAKNKTLFSYNPQGLTSVEINQLNRYYTIVQSIVYRTVKNDPISAYLEIKRLARNERIELEKTPDRRQHILKQQFLSLINHILTELEKIKIIQKSLSHLAGYKIGDRSIYHNMFSPTIRPDFMFTKLMADYPSEGEEKDSYVIGDNAEITIFTYPSSIETLYHVIPPEFKLSEEKYDLLDTARKIMAEHKPREEEFTDPKRMRQVFFNVGSDLIEELAEKKGIRIKQSEVEMLTNILVRYTVGFGLIEVLLQDEKIQDISVNSPMGKQPMYVVHGDYNECTTNIIPTKAEAESWATKLRMISGRPLDEADPILDTELELPGVSTRVSVITKPLDPSGLAFSFRRHREKPWTLPLFIKYKMINAAGAGLLSFLIDGTRTLLVCGTRSSGKTSFLGSIMVEIMRKYRVITVEDTLELPSKSLRDLGFNIQQMKVAAALTRKTTEMSASDGIRSTLRLGDSALIVGEVRSKEAVALYEAMRVGAAANVVAGTIHSDSAYGVYDRVVNDIGVPKTSFKATDIIIVANPIKSADGLHKNRRIVQITEVRKTWENDPLAENGFVDLMKYNAKTDQLEITDALINGESEILKTIAGNIKEFAGNWDAVRDNIELRGKMKQTLVDYSERLQNPDMLEAQFVIKANDIFHLITDRVKQEYGVIDTKRIFYEWEEWLKKEVKI
ncbi:secretion system protein [Candidatus Woesearchaeota archaeon CG10_big_fil_rev_8_21_14_0_10_34_8]|nr:MAG: secretion system protein [Candidatus Woesearchaeota archaeon CG10_big_fil_rev_8_21_14_0_10_34_8]